MINIPNNVITRIEDIGDLSRMVQAWNTFNTEYLQGYFNNGGKPYIAFSNELIRPLLCTIYRSMPSGHIGSGSVDRFVVPLPSLIVYRHFIQDDGSADIEKLDGYSRMLDMCLDRGLSMNAYDSVGLTMLNSSLGYFSIFSKMLPKDVFEESSFAGYSSNLFEYTVSGILLNKGADPYYKPLPNYYAANVLLQATEGCNKLSDQVTGYKKNGTMQYKGLRGYYTDIVSHVSRDERYFAESPYPLYEQRNIVKELVTAGMYNIFSRWVDEPGEVYAEKILSSLRLMLEKGIVTTKVMPSESSNKYYYDSVLRSLTDDLRSSLEALRGRLPLDETTGQDMYRAYNDALDYLRRLLLLLGSYGADPNRLEESGELPMFGLLRPTYRTFGPIYSMFGCMDSVYRYMEDAVKVLVQCGWDPELKDDNGNTLFDYYANKREGKKALKAALKTFNQIRAEEAAYKTIDEEFVR